MSNYDEQVGDVENELGFVLAEIEEYKTRLEELYVERVRLEHELKELEKLNL